MPRFFALTVVLLVVAQSALASQGHRRALIIGLDGTTGNQLHYRALIQKQAPALAELMTDGKFAPCIDMKHPSRGGHLDPRCARAQSGYRTGPDYRWLTGPGWCSVLTGVDNTKTGVKDNQPESLSVFASTSAEHPTFFRRLVSQGFKTAAGGVAAFMTSVNHGEVVEGITDYECGSDSRHRPRVAAEATSSCNLSVRRAGDGKDGKRDVELTQFLVNQIDDPSIDLVMGVMDQVDAAGHAHGFSSNHGYLDAITSADANVAKLIAAVEEGVRTRHEEWLVIVTADHGGHDILLWGMHDVIDKEDDAIPFVVKTFGTTTPLHELTYPVTHMDVHPTVLSWFGISPTPGLDGHVQAIR